MAAMHLPVLILALACAHRNPGPPPLSLEPLLVTPAGASVDATGMTNRELLAEAVDRRLRGDLEGARQRLRVILEQDPAPPESAEALYQLGLAWELEEAWPAALAVYDALVREHPEAPVARDGWFRRSVCLEALGRPRRALQSLEPVPLGAPLDFQDRLTLDLQRGSLLVEAGRRRAGLVLLEEALETAEPYPDLSWLRAKAHVARAGVLLEAAARLHFRGGQDRQARHLEERAALLHRAEQEVTAAALLEEPRWILEGLLLLGDAFRDLHDDLLESRPPRGLSREGREVYHQQVVARAAVLRTKAWRHYDEGIALAGRLQYTGTPLDALKAARAALGDAAPPEP